MDVDAEDIRLLPIVLSHASGPISGVQPCINLGLWQSKLVK